MNLCMGKPAIPGELGRKVFLFFEGFDQRIDLAENKKTRGGQRDVCPTAPVVSKAGYFQVMALLFKRTLSPAFKCSFALMPIN